MKKNYITPAMIMCEAIVSTPLALSIIAGEDADPTLPALTKKTFNLDFGEDDEDAEDEF